MFLHKKIVKMKLLKYFELYELQWSRLLHSGVAGRLLED